MRRAGGQFLAIFLMIFMATYVYVGIFAYIEGMSEGGERYLNEQRLNDLTVETREIAKKDLDKVKKIEKVSEAERVAVVDGKIKLKDGEITLRIHTIESNKLAKMYVVDGEGFSQKEGVWLDAKLAKNRGYKVGDELEVFGGDKKFRRKILGIVLLPDKIYDIQSENQLMATHENYGFGYMASNFSPVLRVYSRMLVGLEKGTTGGERDKIKEEISKIMKNSAILEKKETLSYKTFENEKKEALSYVMAFSGIFMIVAVMTAVSTLTRLVQKQRREIGILKALGMSDRKIARGYLWYGFLVAGLAVVLAGILGPMTLSGRFLKMLNMSYALPELKPIVPWPVHVISLSVVLAMAGIGYLICRKELKKPLIEILKGDRAGVKFENNKKARCLWLMKDWSFVTKWNIRDIFQNKLRTAAGILGICGATVITVCGFGFTDTMNYYSGWQFEDLVRYKYSIKVDEKSSEEVRESLIREVVGERGGGGMMNFAGEVKNDRGFSKKIEISVDDARGNVGYSDEMGKSMKLVSHEGVYVAMKLMRSLGVKVGDKIKWKGMMKEDWQESEIVGVIRKPQNQNIVMTRDYFERAGKFVPNYLYCGNKCEDIEKNKLVEGSFGDINNLDTGGEARMDGEKTRRGIESVQEVIAIRKDFENMMVIVSKMAKMMMGMAVFLAIVIIYNIGSISLAEKKMEFSTLSVVGFRRKRIAKIFRQQNLWVTVLGMGIGLPLGYLVIVKIFEMASGAEYDFIPVVDVWSYVWTGGVILLTAAIMGRVMSRKVC